jgi:hypothetical protein
MPRQIASNAQQKTRLGGFLFSEANESFEVWRKLSAAVLARATFGMARRSNDATRALFSLSQRIGHWSP